MPNASLITVTTATSTKLFDNYAVYLLQTVSKYGLQLQYYDVKNVSICTYSPKNCLIRSDSCI